MHLVWLDPLTTSVYNPINIFLINSNNILYHVLFIRYLWISKILLLSIGLKWIKMKRLKFPYLSTTYFLSLSFYDLGLNLLLKSTLFSNKLVFSASALSILILPLEILSSKDL